MKTVRTRTVQVHRVAYLIGVLYLSVTFPTSAAPCSGRINADGNDEILMCPLLLKKELASCKG